MPTKTNQINLNEVADPKTMKGTFQERLEKALEISRSSFSDELILIGSIDEFEICDYQDNRSVVVDCDKVYVRSGDTDVHTVGATLIMRDIFRSLGSPETLINYVNQVIPLCNVHRCGSVVGKVPDGNVMFQVDRNRSRLESIPLVMEYAFQNESRKVLTFELLHYLTKFSGVHIVLGIKVHTASEFCAEIVLLGRGKRNLISKYRIEHLKTLKKQGIKTLDAECELVDDESSPNLDSIDEDRFHVKQIAHFKITKDDLEKDIEIIVDGTHFELGHAEETIVITSDTLKIIYQEWLEYKLEHEHSAKFQQ